VTGRLQGRRVAGALAPAEHPADIVPADAVADLVADAFHRLAERAAADVAPGTVPAGGDVEDTCARVEAALAGAGLTRS
jgi:hypothetical protein